MDGLFTLPDPLTLIVLIAIAAVGLTEWVKGFFKLAPTWVWGVVGIALCFGVGALAVWVAPIMLYAAVAAALMQLCYVLIVQSVPAIFKGIVARLAPVVKDGAATPPTV
jgi:hypothetical protein